jgi:hypothetical protein
MAEIVNYFRTLVAKKIGPGINQCCSYLGAKLSNSSKKSRHGFAA